MSKPVGGRGHKAPYQTMTIRIPIDVKEQVEEIVERFRSGDLEIVKTEQSDNDIISQITIIIERYKIAAKSSRDWTKCNQLIQELETEIARHE
jgi:coenzyme F420-reducing hydrogenase delta subunit